MLEYKNFYRRFGVFRPDLMVNPRQIPLELLELPKQSIFHYTSEDPNAVGPSSEEFLFRTVTKPIVLGHITEAGDNLGAPRRLPIQVESLIRRHRVINKRYRQLFDITSAARDNYTLIVYSYTLIPRLYRYMRSLYGDYYKWWNTTSAIWKNIAAIANATERQHFVMLKLPRILPSLPDLRIGEGELSQRILKIFAEPENRMILEIWKWLSDNRENSMLKCLKPEQYDKVNLIFEESGKWLVINLGLLNSWRQPSKREMELANEDFSIMPAQSKIVAMLNEIAAEEDQGQNKVALEAVPSGKGMDSFQLQKRFLKMLMVLFEARGVAVSAAQLAEAKKLEDAKKVDDTKTTVVVQTTDIATGVTPEQVKTTSKTTETNIDNVNDDDGEPSSDFDKDIDKRLEEELQALAEISQRNQGADDTEDQVKPEAGISTDILLQNAEAGDLETTIKAMCDNMADNGLLSGAEYRRHLKLSETYKELKAPDGKRTLAEYIKIPLQELEIKESAAIPDIKTVHDKTMLKSSLLDFDKRYITEVLDRDIAASVLNIQHAGVSVTNYEVERVDDIMGSFNNYTVRIVPVEGSPSTIRFSLPIVDEDGFYVANGVKYRLRKQNGDLPIRKIAPDRVALTSYYGKVFVARSSKRVYDYGTWLRSEITLRGLNPEDTSVMDLQPGNAFVNTLKCPRLYSTLAMGFRSFKLQPRIYPRHTGQVTYDVLFDQKDVIDLVGKETVEQFGQQGFMVVGKSDKGHILLLDKENVFYIKSEGYEVFAAGTIESMLELPSEKAPKEFAELKVLGKNIPLALVLGHEMGLENLIKALKIQYRRVPVGTRTNLQPHEWQIVFDDETLVFDKDNEFATLILGGLQDYREAIRQYSVYDFDRKEVYLNVLESKKIGIRYLREIELLYQMFIDPITREILVEMKEPTNFRGLLLRSCEMLLNDEHPDEVDPAYMRKKGYERFAGTVYSEIVRSLRIHKGRADKTRSPVEMNPHSVWTAISQDPSKILVSEINPIQNLKEMESVTFGGTGGRSSRSMTKGTRLYHKNDMGVISEATVDSSDVGINTYTSADPQFTSLRGLSKRFKIGETGPTALLSTSALLSPASDRDDPKRVNFINIQNSHTVACRDYKPPLVQTGYEQVLAHRTGDLFAYSARKPGKVISISESGIVIEYEDGEQKGIELGRRFGNAAGLVIPHDVKTDMKVGQKFKEGAIISYNSGFFERDYVNPNNVIWKSGISVRTILLESTVTFEDSSAISQKVSEMLSTKITYVRTIIVNFTDSIRKLAKVGDKVSPEDILCIIEDAVSANSDAFDDETIDTLRMLSAQTPKAKYTGEIERISVYYYGDKEDMSENLRSIANAGDRELAARNKAAGKKAFTGRVDESFRVDGDPLPLDSMAIQIYITADVAAGTGDKGVFANQLKTVFGDVFQKPIVTESGLEVDAIFGEKSIDDRIVISPHVIGTTSTLLKVIARKAVAAYRNIK